MELQSTSRDSDPAFDLRWDSTYVLNNHSDDSNFRISFHYIGLGADDPTVADLISSLSIDPDIPEIAKQYYGLDPSD